jgi:polyisoprenoid-binding protein YceI
MTRARWILAVAIAAVVVIVGGWLVYAVVINDPAAELTTDDLEQRLTAVTSTTVANSPDTASSSDSASPPDTTTDVAPVGATSDGVWRVTTGSEVGYRVAETLGGIATEGVGRTEAVDGSITIAGTQITQATFTVDVASIRSDSSRRDEQFAGRIMETSLYPTASFVLTSPIELGVIPADGEEITVTAVGDLTLHGVVRSVDVELTARLDNGRVGVLGAIPIVFADHGIANPSFGPVRTEDDGKLEVLLVFERADA